MLPNNCGKVAKLNCQPNGVVEFVFNYFVPDILFFVLHFNWNHLNVISVYIVGSVHVQIGEQHNY